MIDDRTREDLLAFHTSGWISEDRINMIDDRTREELIALVESPGWRWFLNYASMEWTGADAFKRRMLAAAPVGLGDGGLHQTCCSIDMATRAIEMLLDAPRQAIARSKG